MLKIHIYRKSLNQSIERLLLAESSLSNTPIAPLHLLNYPFDEEKGVGCKKERVRNVQLVRMDEKGMGKEAEGVSDFFRSRKTNESESCGRSVKEVREKHQTSEGFEF